MVARLKFLGFGECQVIPSLLLLHDLLWPGMVELVKVPSMGQIDLWKLLV